jgi:hypothetical protein
VETLVWVGVVLVVLTAIFFGLPWAADSMVRNSGSGRGGGTFGVFQELFHPAAHKAEIVIMEQQHRKTPVEGGEDEDPVHDHRPD